MDRSDRRDRQTGALRERVSRLSEASLRVNESLDSGDLERLSVAGPRRPGVLPVPERPAGTAAGGRLEELTASIGLAGVPHSCPSPPSCRPWCSTRACGPQLPGRSGQPEI